MKGTHPMSIIKSIKGLFGQTIHYKDGRKVGETWDGFIPGTKKHYSSDNGYVGSSAKGFLASEVHYNQYGGRVGESWTDDFGVTRHYDSHGRVGISYDGFIGTTSVFNDHQDVFSSSSSDIFDQPKSIFDDADSSFDDSDW